MGDYLSSDREARKQQPIGTGVLDYFPNALAAVAEASWKATQQHHPDKPMHWDRSKSTDEADCLIRHFIDRGKIDSDGVRHSAKVAWRALALLQREIEAERGAAMAPMPRPQEKAGRWKPGSVIPVTAKQMEQIERLDKYCAVHGRWLERYEACMDCLRAGVFT